MLTFRLILGLVQGCDFRADGPVQSFQQFLVVRKPFSHQLAFIRPYDDPVQVPDLDPLDGRVVLEMGDSPLKILVPRAGHWEAEVHSREQPVDLFGNNLGGFIF